MSPPVWTPPKDPFKTEVPIKKDGLLGDGFAQRKADAMRREAARRQAESHAENMSNDIAFTPGPTLLNGGPGLTRLGLAPPGWEDPSFVVAAAAGSPRPAAAPDTTWAAGYYYHNHHHYNYHEQQQQQQEHYSTAYPAARSIADVAPRRPLVDLTGQKITLPAHRARPRGTGRGVRVPEGMTYVEYMERACAPARRWTTTHAPESSESPSWRGTSPGFSGSDDDDDEDDDDDDGATWYAEPMEAVAPEEREAAGGGSGGEAETVGSLSPSSRKGNGRFRRWLRRIF